MVGRGFESPPHRPKLHRASVPKEPEARMAPTVCMGGGASDLPTCSPRKHPASEPLPKRILGSVVGRRGPVVDGVLIADERVIGPVEGIVEPSDECTQQEHAAVHSLVKLVLVTLAGWHPSADGLQGRPRRQGATVAQGNPKRRASRLPAADQMVGEAPLHGQERSDSKEHLTGLRWVGGDEPADQPIGRELCVKPVRCDMNVVEPGGRRRGRPV